MNPQHSYVRVTDGTCEAEDQVGVDFVENYVNINGVSSACAGDTITMIVNPASSALTYTWSPDAQIISGQGTASIQLFLPQDTEVTVTGTNGDCEFSASQNVVASALNPDDVIAVAVPETVGAGETATLTAYPSGYYYRWYSVTDGLIVEGTDVQSIEVQPQATTDYYVIVNEGICAYTATVRVTVQDFVCGPPNVFVPNAFTPNEDDKNDNLYVRGDFITDMKFSIYNRWGEKVFETEDQKVGWGWHLQR